MKAIVMREIGDADVLQYQDVPNPKPETGEVLVRLKAAALNRRDISMRKRSSTAEMLPLILGTDGAGVIADLGPGVDKWTTSEEVVIYPALCWGPRLHRPGSDFRILGGPDQGTYADFIVVPAENLYPKPDSLSFIEAAACPVGALTAWRALITRADVQPGNKVFIPGIGSGVASFALQIAKLAGAIVFVTSHSYEKLEKARQLGADYTANYQTQDWRSIFWDSSGKQGMDVVIDGVGSHILSDGMDLLAPGGRWVTFGATTGAKVELDVRQLYYRQQAILGTTLGSPWEFEQVLRILDIGKILPVIDRTFQLEEAPAAHRYLEAGEQFGKIVLEIS